MLDYSGHFDKNIAIYLTETDNFRHNNWAEKINQMDEAWVGCHASYEDSLNSNVTVPIHVVPYPCDVSKYAQRYEPMTFPELDGKFVFYFIGECTRRKNLVALLKAFHSEFDTEEEVGLVIKASYPGLSPAACTRRITELIGTVKKQLRKNPSSTYHTEVVVTQRFSEEQMMCLHAGCDCFVMPSFGEGWCLPAFDAMAMGKTPIVTECGAFPDYLGLDFDPNVSGWLVPGTLTPCFGMEEVSIPEIHTGNENWTDIDVLGLRECMREAFENEEERKKRSANGIDKAYDFSYEIIGQRMKEILNGDRQPILSGRASQIRQIDLSSALAQG